MGLEGLWWGLVLVNGTISLIMLAIFISMDFEDEAHKAVARSQTEPEAVLDPHAGLLEPLLYES